MLATLRLLSGFPSSVPEPCRLHCICFGAPAIGNTSLASMVAAKGWNVYFKSYVLPEDPIPHMLLDGALWTRYVATADGTSDENQSADGINRLGQRAPPTDEEKDNWESSTDNGLAVDRRIQRDRVHTDSSERTLGNKSDGSIEETEAQVSMRDPTSEKEGNLKNADTVGGDSQGAKMKRTMSFRDQMKSDRRHERPDSDGSTRNDVNFRTPWWPTTKSMRLPNVPIPSFVHFSRPIYLLSEGVNNGTVAAAHHPSEFGTRDTFDEAAGWLRSHRMSSYRARLVRLLLGTVSRERNPKPATKSEVLIQKEQEDGTSCLADREAFPGIRRVANFRDCNGSRDELSDPSMAGLVGEHSVIQRGAVLPSLRISVGEGSMPVLWTSQGGAHVPLSRQKRNNFDVERGTAGSNSAEHQARPQVSNDGSSRRAVDMGISKSDFNFPQGQRDGELDAEVATTKIKRRVTGENGVQSAQWLLKMPPLPPRCVLVVGVSGLGLEMCTGATFEMEQDQGRGIRGNIIKNNANESVMEALRTQPDDPPSIVPEESSSGAERPQTHTITTMGLRIRDSVASLLPRSRRSRHIQRIQDRQKFDVLIEFSLPASTLSKLRSLEISTSDEKISSGLPRCSLTSSGRAPTLTLYSDFSKTSSTIQVKPCSVWLMPLPLLPTEQDAAEAIVDRSFAAIERAALQEADAQDQPRAFRSFPLMSLSAWRYGNRTKKTTPDPMPLPKEASPSSEDLHRTKSDVSLGLVLGIRRRLASNWLASIPWLSSSSSAVPSTHTITLAAVSSDKLRHRSVSGDRGAEREEDARAQFRREVLPSSMLRPWITFFTQWKPLLTSLWAQNIGNTARRSTRHHPARDHVATIPSSSVALRGVAIVDMSSVVHTSRKNAPQFLAFVSEMFAWKRRQIEECMDRSLFGVELPRKEHHGWGLVSADPDVLDDIDGGGRDVDSRHFWQAFRPERFKLSRLAKTVQDVGWKALSKSFLLRRWKLFRQVPSPDVVVFVVDGRALLSSAISKNRYATREISSTASDATVLNFRVIDRMRHVVEAAKDCGAIVVVGVVGRRPMDSCRRRRLSFLMGLDGRPGSIIPLVQDAYASSSSMDHSYSSTTTAPTASPLPEEGSNERLMLHASLAHAVLAHTHECNIGWRGGDERRRNGLISRL